jgi:CheY-like chemotaxis protein
LSGVVGATLRAAIDLALGDQPTRRPLSATWDDGALDVILPEVRLENLTSAGALLETVDGSLGPGRDGRSFLIRVQVAAPRPMYLMLQQGTLGLAIPWHSVIRVRLLRKETLENVARREGCPVLPPFVAVPTTQGERPAVLIALGLRRAFVIADRLVWRMPAVPVETEDTAPSSLGPAVRNTDGEIFWVADPARLLKEVEPVPLPSPPPPPGRPVLPPPTPASTSLRSPAPARPLAKPRLIELRPEDVEPLETPQPPEPTRPSESPTTSAAPAPPPAPAPRPGRRALVVEDSIVGRIFLQRLLESQGFSVEALSSASQLRHARIHGWDVLFVDVSLPDSARGEHLEVLASSPVVALVRDAHDEKLASDHGIRFALRKPFERGDLLRVIEALGLQGKSA